MSMTMIAFIEKDKIPSQSEMEIQIEKLGYNLKFPEGFDKIDGFDGFCKLNDIETFFEVYSQERDDILSDFPSLNENLEEYDYGISFNWGADFIAGASIGVIALALMDICNSKILYVDDEIWYTREMFVQEIPIFIEEHQKESNQKTSQVPKKNSNKRIKDFVIFGLLFVSAILLGRKIIPWHIPAVLLLLAVINGIIEFRKKTRR